MIYLSNHIKASKLAAFMLSLLWVFFTSCHENKRTDVDTPSTGTIHISVDETFKPVIDSEIQHRDRAQVMMQ